MLRKMIKEGIEAVAAGKNPVGVPCCGTGKAILDSGDKVTDGLMATGAAE
jgi:hypothetical protein